MKEDRAAAPAAPTAVVIVEDDHDVIEMVVAPQALVRPGTRDRDEPVVGWARHVIAPSEARAERRQRQGRTPSPHPVRPIIAEQERKGSDGARVIAFPLHPAQSAGAERTRDDEPTCMQSPGLELSLSSWRCAARHHKARQADPDRSRSCERHRGAFSWRHLPALVRIHLEFTSRRMEWRRRSLLGVQEAKRSERSPKGRWARPDLVGGSGLSQINNLEPCFGVNVRELVECAAKGFFLHGGIEGISAAEIGSGDRLVRHPTGRAQAGRESIDGGTTSKDRARACS